MNQEFLEYVSKLHLFIQNQDKRIQKLEQLVAQMQVDYKKLKEQPAVRVDRIEYKFDQLKVETLEGTLNIGLNPSDLQGISDFSVTNQSVKAPFTPGEMMQRSIEIEERLYSYVDDHLPTIFAETLTKLNTEIDESYLLFIQDDVKKQIPNRAEHYLREFASTDRSPQQEEETMKKITERLHQEMEHGVATFISNLPENVKGMKQE